MWIPILVIVMTIALAFGPVMWLRPPPSERRLAKFRARAIELGMHVRMVTTKSLNRNIAEKGSSIAFYQLPWNMSNPEEKSISKRDNLNQWMLLNSSLEHEINFYKSWNWRSSRPPEKLPLVKLHVLIANLPADLIALECSPQGVAIGWWETGDVSRVDELRDLLIKFKQVYAEDIAGSLREAMPE